MKEELIFTSMIYPVEASEAWVLLLLESIRSYAGSFSQARIWCYVPQYGKQLSPATQDRLHELGVEVIPFDIDLDTLRFFFSGEITALALAESRARDQTEILAWLDANTLVLQEPTEFLLPSAMSLGFRPVHHTLVGSRYDQPLDLFWMLVYRCCHVPEDRVFPMRAHVDGIKIRPYFNAGILVVRPQKGLFQAWRDTFFDVYQRPDFVGFYQQDKRYAIFIHQAVLSGVALSTFTIEEMSELPPAYNYPLHLYLEDATDQHPSRLEDLVTCRYESIAEDLRALKIPAGESLKRWIVDRISQ